MRRARSASLPAPAHSRARARIRSVRPPGSRAASSGPSGAGAAEAGSAPRRARYSRTSAGMPLRKSPPPRSTSIIASSASTATVSIGTGRLVIRSGSRKMRALPVTGRSAIRNVPSLASRRSVRAPRVRRQVRPSQRS